MLVWATKMKIKIDSLNPLDVRNKVEDKMKRK